jgi:hypothetical protein
VRISHRVLQSQGHTKIAKAARFVSFANLLLLEVAELKDAFSFATSVLIHKLHVCIACAASRFKMGRLLDEHIFNGA